jgi:hypothetical protein
MSAGPLQVRANLPSTGACRAEESVPGCGEAARRAGLDMARRGYAPAKTVARSHGGPTGGQSPAYKSGCGQLSCFSQADPAGAAGPKLGYRHRSARRACVRRDDSADLPKRTCVQSATSARQGGRADKMRAHVQCCCARRLLIARGSTRLKGAEHARAA